jgi:hypothetical protein
MVLDSSVNVMEKLVSNWEIRPGTVVLCKMARLESVRSLRIF